MCRFVTEGAIWVCRSGGCSPLCCTPVTYYIDLTKCFDHVIRPNFLASGGICMLSISIVTTLYAVNPMICTCGEFQCLVYVVSSNELYKR